MLRRHFWRYATFSDVAEIYTSRTLRMMAINLAGVLMSVFLYQNGYSIMFIGAYWGIYFATKIPMCLPAAKYVAHYGPKHATLLSNGLYIPALIAFSFVPQLGMYAMAVTVVFQGFSAAMYEMGYMIHFSKVKSDRNAGKEIAYMNMFEKIATGVSPLIGGLIAYMAGPQAALWVASSLFVLASIPLLFTPEPVKTRQKLVFRGFPWRIAWTSLVAKTGASLDLFTSATIWPLFVAVAILGVTGDDVYAKLGLLLSIVVLAALVSSYMFGRLIDRRRGGELLRYSVYWKSITHIIRPFVGTVGGVVGVNVANEVAETGYSMALMRGFFDTADLSGQRVTYFALISIANNVGMSLGGGLLCLFVWLTRNDILGMQLLFGATAVIVLLVATARFQLYRR